MQLRDDERICLSSSWRLTRYFLCLFRSRLLVRKREVAAKRRNLKSSSLPISDDDRRPLDSLSNHSHLIFPLLISVINSRDSAYAILRSLHFSDNLLSLLGVDPNDWRHHTSSFWTLLCVYMSLHVSSSQLSDNYIFFFVKKIVWRKISAKKKEKRKFHFQLIYFHLKFL